MDTGVQPAPADDQPVPRCCADHGRGLTRRRLAAAAAAAAGVSLAAAVACAGGGRSRPLDQLKAAPVTLRYLTWWGQDRLPTVEAWKQAFRDEWPKVQLDPELVTAKEYPTRFQTVLAAGTPPDVVLSRHEVQTRWYDAGVHLDMTDLLARDKISLQRDYALGGTELWCGKTYGLPMNADANAVFYNKTLLARLGLKDPWSIDKGDWSLDDLARLAKQATQDVDRDGTVDQWGLWMEYTHPSQIGQFVWTRGGDVADFQQMRYTLDSPVSLEVHRQFYDWLLKDRLVLTDADAARIAREAPGRDAFSAGKVAFRIRAVGDVVKYQKEVGGAFEWDVIHFPQQDDKHPGIPLVAGGPHCVVKASRVAEQAYQWARFIAGPRGQELLAQSLALPALKSKQDVYLKDKTPPTHVAAFRDVFGKPYGNHFRHHYTDDSWALYAKEVVEKLAAGAPLQGTLQQGNRLMNDTIKYGDCQPYKGMEHPIRPKK